MTTNIDEASPEELRFALKDLGEWTRRQIEILRAENERLRAALEKIAAADHPGNWLPDLARQALARDKRANVYQD